ncbi:hypothetical protein ACIGNX_18065 [Actinosynnema sp. NPDC053489]|uniref:hypothetical protein n=1 Tax=Actinosynnema sp. NPDC053489 TaxID=3363916 RepID=UPI0037CAD6C3
MQVQTEGRREADLALLPRVLRTGDSADHLVHDRAPDPGPAPATGLLVLVAVLNPRRVVLGGYSAALQDRLVAPQRHGRTPVVASALGFTAGGTGAAPAAVRPVLDDPTAVPVKDNATQAGGSHEGAQA